MPPPNLGCKEDLLSSPLTLATGRLVAFGMEFVDP
jgi:hypothetical protein